LTESMISVQSHDEYTAPLWLYVLGLVEIAWVAAISLTLYWLIAR
jgi:hypothetical protein